MTGNLLAQTDGFSISRIFTIMSIVLSVVSLTIAFWKARAFLPLRPAFDYGRLALQLAAVLLMGALSGVSTAPALLLGAAMLGGGLGYFQGASLDVTIQDGLVVLRRSVVGVAIWGAGLILMQLAGFANRAGVVRLGQAVAWFSIGLGFGLLAGRHPRVQEAVRATGAALGIMLLVAATSGLVLIKEIEPAAAQTTCPSAPNGWREIFTEFEEHCRYEGVGGDTATISPSGGPMCGAALAEHWADFPGSPGASSNINVRSASAGFERVLVLGPNAVVLVAANIVSGSGVAERFADTAREYMRLNYPACAAAGPATTAANGTNPPGTTAPPRTSIVTETFPDEPPPVATIEDQGAALTSTAAPRATTAPTTTQSVTAAPTTTVPQASTTTTQAPTTTTTGTGQVALPPVEGEDQTDLGENDITEEEALQQAVAGLLLAGLLGLLSWAEAFQAIDLLSGAPRGTAQANHGHLQHGSPPPPQPAPVGASPAPGAQRGNSTPVDTYLPPNTPPQSAPSNTPGQRPGWIDPDADDPADAPRTSSESSSEPDWAASPGTQPTSPPQEGTETPSPGVGDHGTTDFAGWGLDQLEHEQLDPDGAPTQEHPGMMGGPSVRIEDRDGDGIYDHAEYDDDNDGHYDRGGPLGPDGRPQFEDSDSPDVEADQDGSTDPEDDGATGGREDDENEPAEPMVFGSAGGPQTTLLDTDGDGIFDRFQHDADGDGETDKQGRLERRDGDVFLVPDGAGDSTGDAAAEPPARSGAERPSDDPLLDSPPAPSEPDPLDPLLDALEDGPDLGPEPAEPMEVDIGGHRTRLTDTDGDGEYDRVEADIDGDGVFDRTGRMTTGPDGEQVFVPDAEAPASTSDDSNGPAAETLDGDEVEVEPETESADSATPPEPLTRREIEDLWRWGLERGRSLDDIREDIAGLNEARGGTEPIDDPFGLVPTPTESGPVPLTPGEAAHHAELRQELAALKQQRDAFDEQWRQLVESRNRATRHELNAEMRQMATALEVWEAENELRSRVATEREWIRVYKMWRAGDTWMDDPNGGSFYGADLPSDTELTRAIAERMENIDRIERERIRAIEAAQQRGRPSDQLDALDRMQDDLLARRRQLDTAIDGVQGSIDRYESFGEGRPLPQR